MANSLKAPPVQPCEHATWRSEVLMWYPEAFIQDDSTPSSLRERVLHKGQLVAFFMRPHSTGKGSGYIREPTA